jgi:hypothetical protein
MEYRQSEKLGEEVAERKNRLFYDMALSTAASMQSTKEPAEATLVGQVDA